MKKFCFWVICLLVIGHITVSAQSQIYYLGSLKNRYDQLLRNAPTGDCYLEPRVGTTDRLPVDSTIVSSQSPASLRITWKSAVKGDWIAGIRMPGDPLIDVTGYESLSF